MKRGQMLAGCAILVAFSCWSDTSGAAKPDSVTWQKDLNKAQETSKSEKRPILLFVTADGCVYCQKMSLGTYAHPSVTSTIKESFVPAVINATNHPNWVKAARINSFPVALIVTWDGRILGKLNGYADSAKMNRWLRQNSRSKTAAKVETTIKQ